MQADLHYIHNDIGGAQVLLRCLVELNRLGLSIEPHSGVDPSPISNRLLICHHSYLTEDFLSKLGRDVVVLERFDSSGTRCADLASHQKVKMIVKGAKCIDMIDVPRRPHYELMAPGSQDRSNLSAEDARKYVSGLTLGQYDLMRFINQRRPLFDKPQKVDVFFGGLLRDGEPIIHQHRLGCVEAIESLPQNISRLVIRGRQMPRSVYNKCIYGVKIMVSPWGYGEACYRDWEAWGSGSILIKPNTDYVDCWPGVYEDGKTYFSCRHDWSDLGDVVQRVLDQWPDLMPMRDRNRKMFESAYQPPAIARWFVETLKERGLWR